MPVPFINMTDMTVSYVVDIYMYLHSHTTEQARGMHAVFVQHRIVRITELSSVTTTQGA